MSKREGIFFVVGEEGAGQRREKGRCAKARAREDKRRVQEQGEKGRILNTESVKSDYPLRVLL
jgi:hypothetical protein